jgi:mRNA interferase RelE/StbE
MLNLTKGLSRNEKAWIDNREQLKKKLKKLQQNPYVESVRLHGDLAGCFQIKLRASGFRLIYKFIDDENVIWVVAVGKSEDE